MQTIAVTCHSGLFVHLREFHEILKLERIDQGAKIEPIAVGLLDIRCSMA